MRNFFVRSAAGGIRGVPAGETAGASGGSRAYRSYGAGRASGAVFVGWDGFVGRLCGGEAVMGRVTAGGCG